MPSPPRWFKNAVAAVDDVFDNLADDVAERVAETVDLAPVAEHVRSTGSTSNQLAKETTALCLSTHAKSVQMIAFCSDLRETLATTVDGGVDADALETIQELLSGETLKTAMALAKDMNADAIQCVQKSVQMVDIIEDTMEKLPKPLRAIIEKALEDHPEDTKSRGIGDGEEDDDDDDDQLRSLDKDIADVKECIDAISHLNLFTALEVGKRAFEQFALKARVSRELFSSIQGYSETISEITDAFGNLDLITIVKRVKDMWKCLKYTGLMKDLAKGLGTLIEMVIDLFEATSTRVAGLWKALAYAKDCVRDCVEHAQQAKGLCLEAADKSSTLMEQSRLIKDRLEDMGELNAGSIAAFKDLADGEEISSAISIAMEMDDIVLACAGKAVAMVNRVLEGFANLPPLVTDGIVVEEDGNSDDDPEPANVDRNIVDLEANTTEINEANIVAAVRAGSRGFGTVSDNVVTAKDMISLVHNFAENCMAVVESFLGVWDIPSAIDKIKEMCRIVKLGEMMKQFANQVKNLIMAVINLMRAFIDKCKNMIDLDNLADHALDGLKEGFGKLGSLFKRDGQE